MHPTILERSAPSDLRWYLAETKRHSEETARAFLHAKGLHTYLPRAPRWPRPAVGSAVGALFSGYLFVQADLARHHRTIERATGIKRLVAFGAQGPVEVPEYVIRFLSEREGPDGLIHCIGEEELDGREVELVRGPLRELHGIVERRISGGDRVVLLIELLRRQVRVETPVAWLRVL